MKRIVGFGFVTGFYICLTWGIVEWLNLDLKWGSFGAGIFIAGLAGATLFLIEGWWDTYTRPNHPQRVYVETKEAPSQIVGAAFWALVRLFLVIVGMGIALGLVISRSLQGFQ